MGHIVGEILDRTTLCPQEIGTKLASILGGNVPTSLDLPRAMYTNAIGQGQICHSHGSETKHVLSQLRPRRLFLWGKRYVSLEGWGLIRKGEGGGERS